jgi:hypothetical protein
MALRKRRPAAWRAFVLGAIAAGLSALSAAAQNVPSQKTDDRAGEVSARFRPSGAGAAGDWGRHPLTPVIDYARKEQSYLRGSVSDFACRLVKRERIGGFLQDYHYIDMEVREEVVAGDRIARPLSIYLHFLGPQLVAGRKVIYIEGQNEGKMLVRNGGRHFDYVIARIDPQGENAREESLVPVTEIGFTRLLERMIDVLQRHRAADPAGGNTKSERIAGAKIDGRACTLVRVTHPRKMDGLEFHVANVFVDDELHVPVRVDYSEWPRNERAAPPLVAEYTYTQLRLNVNLPDAAFNRSRLRSGRD